MLVLILQNFKHGVSLVLEKGCDLFGAGAAAQGDIRAFYDCLPMLLISHFLTREGVPSTFVALCLRLQVLMMGHLRWMALEKLVH